MTDDEFAKLKETILLQGGYHREPTNWNSHNWWIARSGILLRYNSARSKYKGSILSLNKIKDDRIHAICSISGAPKIQPFCEYKTFELTTDKVEKYLDNTIGTDTVKDFFDDDINIGDYVFGEYDRCIIFGRVEATKLGCGKKHYSSRKNEFDAAMVNVVKIKSRDKYHPACGQRLLEMKYFIKVEDPTLYLLKL